MIFIEKVKENSVYFKLLPPGIFSNRSELMLGFSLLMTNKLDAMVGAGKQFKSECSI